MRHSNPVVARVCAAALIPMWRQQGPTDRGGTAAQPGRGGRGPQVISPEVQPDRHVTFRLLAPRLDQLADLPEPVCTAAIPVTKGALTCFSFELSRRAPLWR